ncbi:hypothetical protein [Curtobacterium sp. 'Ferrero']|nr:hypothetical protein [Curtobacterium sp. 'Ferrero']
MIQTDAQSTDRDELQCRPVPTLTDAPEHRFGRWLGLINDGR